MNHGWEKKRLGDVCSILNGFAFKSREYVSSGIRIIRIANVQDGYISDELPQFYPDESISMFEKYLLHENDLLISLTGNVGRVALLPSAMLPAALNQRVACLRTHNVNKKYIYHFLQNVVFKQDCIDASTGIAQLNLSTEWLKEYKILLPPISCQKKIVDELDRINELIEVKRSQLADLDLLAQSLFYEMFGEPFLNPMGWDIKAFGDLTDSINYGTSLPATEGGRYPYLRMNNLTDNGYLDLSNLKYIDIPDEDVDKCLVKDGDILFNRTNSREKVGKTALYDREDNMVIAGYIIRVRANRNRLNPVFAVRYMNMPELKNHLRKICRGAVNQANINSKEMAAIPFLVPPIELQNQFATKIKKIEAQKESIESSITDLQTLLASRMDYWYNV